MDISQLGVDVLAVAIIVATVQTVKNKFFKGTKAKNAFLAAAIMSGLWGFLNCDLTLPLQEILKTIFAYMTATSFTYSGAKHMGLGNVLIGQSKINVKGLSDVKFKKDTEPKVR